MESKNVNTTNPTNEYIVCDTCGTCITVPLIKINADLLEACKAIYKLIDDDDLVRDISKDDNTKYYIQQGLRIAGALSKLQSAIHKAKNEKV